MVTYNFTTVANSSDKQIINFVFFSFPSVVQGLQMHTPTSQMSQQQFSMTERISSSASPPVFEQIFRNARFAQGGNALFEGKIRGNPKPTVTWTRKGAPLLESSKFQMRYEEQTGNVSLLINKIGPGDEGEYTCTARNQYGEAICSVYIQPEGKNNSVVVLHLLCICSCQNRTVLLLKTVCGL